MEITGFWGSVHVISAGCASIAAYEMSHLLFTGAMAIAFFGALALGLMHVAHHHHRRMVTGRQTATAVSAEAARE